MGFIHCCITDNVNFLVAILDQVNQRVMNGLLCVHASHKVTVPLFRNCCKAAHEAQIDNWGWFTSFFVVLQPMFNITGNWWGVRCISGLANGWHWSCDCKTLDILLLGHGDGQVCGQQLPCHSSGVCTEADKAVFLCWSCKCSVCIGVVAFLVKVASLWAMHVDPCMVAIHPIWMTCSQFLLEHVGIQWSCKDLSQGTLPQVPRRLVWFLLGWPFKSWVHCLPENWCAIIISLTTACCWHDPLSHVVQNVTQCHNLWKHLAMVESSCFSVRE